MISIFGDQISFMNFGKKVHIYEYTWAEKDVFKGGYVEISLTHLNVMLIMPWHCIFVTNFEKYVVNFVIFSYFLGEKWSWYRSSNWSRSPPVIVIFFQWSLSIQRWSLIFDLDHKISDLLQLWIGHRYDLRRAKNCAFEIIPSTKHDESAATASSKLSRKSLAIIWGGTGFTNMPHLVCSTPSWPSSFNPLLGYWKDRKTWCRLPCRKKLSCLHR